ncbi:methyltransferase domain-containing protein [Enhygromyxa salina]|uniref:Dimethylglycine N methyltransferase n=1 Tax=Enhygromyxa salina TaxID=215803 RepID=A0A109ZX66_9BACT|nr:methyltransferase domain-containing protein [Enhygromyxa salina]AMH38942.1 dimethylglycine N methyltransferase [Enhygromyxa salina]PRQ09320.1 Sarcosine/dimethylglycine N-methyltransferase [Enhygromyxa salina]
MTRASVTQASAATQAAQSYYDSDEADQFYFNIWGGEDIHIGLYDEAGERSIHEAGRRIIDRMIELLGPITAADRVLDLGSGYGGAARVLARRFDCNVVCLNLSETQNARNRELCQAAQLARVQVRQGNFEHLPFADESVEIAWSQDAILHSGARQQVINEVARVLRPGGRFVFTDPMRRDHVPAASLGPILERIHLDDLACFEFYRRACAEAGLEVVTIQDLSVHLPRHYERVRVELEARRAEIESLSTPSYVAGMLGGLRRWVEAGEQGLLAWGIVVARKPGPTGA